MSGTINREVGKQGKGFRLQRLRAIRLLLNEMKKSVHAMVYAATEYMDGVYVKSGHHGEVREYAEGDKDYDPKKSFSFMSNEVTTSQRCLTEGGQALFVVMNKLWIRVTQGAYFAGDESCRKN